MICDNCRKNEATIHFIQLGSGQDIKKFDLCKECVKDLSFLADGNFEIEDSSISSNILAIDLGFFNEQDTDNIMGAASSNQNKKCISCSTTLDLIKKTGRVGCPRCYDEFYDELNPLIKIIQSGIEHKGKIPLNCNQRLKIEKKIKELKFKMEEQIIVENFEEAALLRDKISSLQKKMHYSGRKLKNKNGK